MSEAKNSFKLSHWVRMVIYEFLPINTQITKIAAISNKEREILQSMKNI